MHHSAKGIKVKPTERSAKTQSPRTGRFAALRGLPRSQGSGAPPLAAVTLACLATLAVSAVSPVAASAAVGPKCEAAIHIEEVNGNGSVGHGTGQEVAGFTGVKLVAEPTKRTLTSVVLGGKIYRECETGWRLEYSTSPDGPWLSIPGGSGTVDEPLGIERTEGSFETGELTGLEPETPYYERGILTNVLGVNEENSTGSFETRSLGPRAYPRAAESIAETSAELSREFEPAPFETEWRVEYATSESGPWTVAAKGSISQAEAEAQQNEGGTNAYVGSGFDLSGLSPGSTYYTRVVAEDEPEWPVGSGIKRHKESTSVIGSFVTSGPPVAETFVTHGLHGESVRVLGSIVPHGFDTHYYFQYGPTVAYGSVTPTSDAGSGGGRGIEPVVVGAGLPGLQAGETYHYRLVASSAAVGGTVYGADRTFTAPVPVAVSAPAACGNERFRVGPSAGLPDCRAYEQVTPVDKEGAVEPFAYGTLGVGEPGGLLGEDGEHFMVSSQFTNWGAGTGKSPYFFARGEEGWRMTPGAPQPEAGIDHYYPQLYAPDLTSFAFAADWTTSEGAQSPDVEFKTGPPGGPYLTAASVPRSEVGPAPSHEGGWVAASQDFSKLILAVDDRALVPGHPSVTASGYDLYEYAGGALHQVNVDSAGKTVGVCGATIADGNGEPTTGVSDNLLVSSPHAVSADGSRVFFEAAPGSDCSEAKHLYMRAGSETRDLGVYKFVAANADGSKVILEAGSGDTREVLLYETGPATTKLLFTAHENNLTGGEHLHLQVSADLSVLYLTSSASLTPEAPAGVHVADGISSSNLYRYDIETGGPLRFLVSLVLENSGGSPGYGPVPNGRYYYFLSREVIGLPGGEALNKEGQQNPQLYRYDSAEGVVECVSCASSFDPEPRWEVTSNAPTGVGAVELTEVAMPDTTRITADGSRVFFDTRSALVPQDVAGEVSLLEGDAETTDGSGFSDAYSPHSQVYEWREDGIEGCAQLQGCISLLSGDTGGYFVQLIGIAEEGRDVFFTTHSQLGPNDHDSQGDVYDARAGGGEPPTPPRPVECEGDSCSTPFAAPSDLTPSSATFQGAGDLTPPPAVVKPPVKKAAKCSKGKTRNKKGQCVKVKKAKKQARARKSNHRRGK